MAFVKRENLDHYMDGQTFNDVSHGDLFQQSAQSAQTSITAFLAKLWALVNDSSCDDLICWDPSGSSFHVYDQSKFAREVLPKYFKHNNFASFIRQLNMYGFRKMSTIEHGSLKSERDDIEFAHPHFVRGQESLLELIKRRAPDQQQKTTINTGTKSSNVFVSTSNPDNKAGRPLEVNRLIEDVKNLQNKQTSLTDKLSFMQSENQALWSEISSLRQKHVKQQQIVSKLMEFLLNFFAQHSQSNGRSVEHIPNNEIITNQSFSPQFHSNLKPDSEQLPDSTSMTFGQKQPTNVLLKRKQPVLMIEEPTKRLAADKKVLFLPMNINRQPSVTINELTDTDLSSWVQAGDEIPLVDLVPSPPPTHHDLEDHRHHHQRQLLQPRSNTHGWPNLKTDHQQPITQQLNDFNYLTVNNSKNTIIPDFILQRDDNKHGKQADFGLSTSQISLADMKTSQTNGPNRDGSKLILNEKNPEISQAILNEPQRTDPSIRLSVDDITGDVDHIQSSLENIRDLMFENIPDDTRSIGSLFDEESELLLPLLEPSEMTTDQSTLSIINQDLNSVDNSKVEFNLPSQSKPISSMHAQLFEKFIHGSTKVEEQRQTINQLEREKLDLQAKVHNLEQRNSRKH